MAGAGAAEAAAPIDVKRYDRQIRLWGLETQLGLQGTHVLLLGANGLCNEIAKNLVLAGVGHVCIQDPTLLAEDHLRAGGLFSVGKSAVGENKASALAAGLRELNPQVEISSSTIEVAQMDADFLSSFQFIVGTHGIAAVKDIDVITDCLSPSDGVNGAEATRAAKRPRSDDSGPPLRDARGAHVERPARASGRMPKLMAAGAMGLSGFCCVDLLRYQYTPTPKALPNPTDPQPSSAEAVTYEVAYPTIAEAFEADWTSLGQRVPRLYCALQLLCQADAEADLPSAAEELRRQRLAAAGLQEGFLREPLTAEFVATIARTAQAEMPAVCAIIGGLVASEVIKIISGKEPPMNNLLLYDATAHAASSGVIGRFGPSLREAWGLDQGKPRALKPDK